MLKQILTKYLIYPEEIISLETVEKDPRLLDRIALHEINGLSSLSNFKYHFKRGIIKEDKRFRLTPKKLFENEVSVLTADRWFYDYCRVKDTVYISHYMGIIVYRDGDYKTIATHIVAPRDIAFHNDELYVVDEFHNRVCVCDLEGNHVRYLGKGLTSPHGVAVDKEGHVYIADTFNHRVQVVDRNNALQKELKGFRYPYSVSFPGGKLKIHHLG